MTARELGGIVVRAEAGLVFVPASIAQKLIPLPKVAEVPDAPAGLLGVALVDGTVIPIVAIGALRDTILVCNYLGEAMGIVGHSVVASGTFEAVSEPVGAVKCEAGVAKPLDLALLAASLSKNAWAGRSIG